MAMTEIDTRAVLGDDSGPQEEWAGELILEFTAGLPGFPDARRFALSELDGLQPFCGLRSLDPADVCFTVVAPGLVLPDYTVSVDEDHMAALHLQSAADAAVLAIVTVPPAPQLPTINLLGPIVVNRTTLLAAQVVQHWSDYPVAYPLQVAAGG